MALEIAKDGGISRPKFLDKVLRLRKISLILAYIAAYFCAQYIFDPANMEVTRISEHSLMPGLVTPKFDKSGIAIQLYRRLSDLKKTQSQQQFILDIFSELNLECFTQNFKSTIKGYPATGQNVYGFIRGHRNDGAEAQLIVVQLGRSESARRMISRMLAFVDYARDQVYWARDFVIVFVDGTDENGKEDMEKAAFALDSFLLKYQKIESLNPKRANQTVIADEIQAQTGALIAGVVYDLSGVSVKGQHIINVKTNGLNGQQVNLDVFNGVVKIADSKHHSKVAIFGTLHRHTSPYQHYSPYTVPILALYTQAFVSIEGIHSVMGKYGVQGLTVGLSFDYSERQAGQFIEEVSRMLNNVLERLHQSYFMYVLADDMHFSSIGFYITSVSILLVPLVAGIYYESRKPWPLVPVTSYFVSTFCGFSLYYGFAWMYRFIGPHIVLSLDFPFVGAEGCAGQITPPFNISLLFAALTLVPFGYFYFSQNPLPSIQVPQVRCIIYTQSAIVLICSSLINYGLGVYIAGCSVPVIMLTSFESSHRERSMFRAGVLCILSPLFIVTMFIYNLNSMVGGFLPIETPKSILAAPESFIMTMLRNDAVFGSWHFFLLCTCAWPIWTMLFAAALPYNLDVDRDDSRRSTPATTPE